MKIDESWFVKPNKIKDRIAAGGVVAKVFVDQIMVLLTRGDIGKEWILPKGGVENGESLEIAAMREIKEETGARNIKLLAKLGVKERLTFEKDYWSITHYYLFITNKDPETPTDKLTRYVTSWFPIDKLPAIYWPEQKELIEENIDKIKSLISALKSK